MAGLVICTYQLAGAQDDYFVKAQVDRARVDAGDALVYTVEAATAGESSVTPDIVLPEFGQAFQVGDVFTRSSVNILNGKTRIVHIKEAHLTARESGSVLIPPSRVEFIQAHSQERIQRESEPLRVQINQFTGAAAVPTATPEIDVLRPIKKRAHVSATQWLPWGIAGTLALTVLGLTAFFRQRAPMSAVRHEPVDTRSPEERAMEALEAAKELKEAGRVDEFYMALSLIVRRYLGEMFGINAQEATTREILDMLAAHSLDSGFLDEYRRYAEEGDKVKYARHTPATPEIDLAYQQARQLILHPQGPRKAAETDPAESETEPPSGGTPSTA